MRRIRFKVAGWALPRRFFTAYAILLTVIAPAAQAQPGAASDRFSIPHQANDAGGGRSASARFEMVSSIAPLGEVVAAVAPVTMRSGFPGQLNEPPLVTGDQVSATAGGPLTIPTSNLLANDSDAEGDVLQFISVASVSAKGVPLSLLGASIVYDASTANALDDTFTYTVFDGFDYTIGTVVITFSQLERITLGIILSAQGARPLVQVHGFPGHTYQLQTTSDLASPIRWSNLGAPQVAPADGLIEQLDPAPGEQRYYRAIKP